MSAVLQAHRVLVGSALGMSLVLGGWSVSHFDQPGAQVALGLSVLAVPACGLYLRKLFRNPPIR